MRNFMVLSLLSVFLVFPALAQDGARFSSVIEDLPLASALSEVGEGVEFSSPSGRIAEFSAQGTTTSRQVLAFYDATLPQLGWTKTAPGSYLREHERLTLAFEQYDDVLHVHFSLSPSKNRALSR